MCGCDGFYVCPSCAGTPTDPLYVDDEPAREPGRDYCDCGAHVEGLPCYFPPIIFAPVRS
jgi:hypothetical protein